MSKIEPDWSDASWPYDARELAEIAACLKTDAPRRLGEILHAARVFAALKTRRAKKPNAREEIADVKARALDLYAALSRMSDEAENHLHAHWKAAFAEIHDKPVSRDDLLSGLHRFIHENDAGFDAPPSPSRGPVEQKDEAWLIWQIHCAFIAGHDGKSPARGWPRFRDLCWQPLAAKGIANNLSERAMQQKLTEARRYFDVIHTK